MPTVVDKKTTTAVAPFGVEANPTNNGDLMLQSLEKRTLRGRIDATKRSIRGAKDMNEDYTVIPVDRIKYLGQLPKIPGMQIHVNPAKLTWKIIDPLHDDDEMCERIRRALSRIEGMAYRPPKIQGHPPQSGKLSNHFMKTLVRELVWNVESDQAFVVMGEAPSIEDVDQLPGKYLMNAGSTTYRQPKYEEDFREWEEKLIRAGG